MTGYTKARFDPETLQPGRFKRVRDEGAEDWAYDWGQGSGAERHFVFAEAAVLALNVAMATGRPLLVSGEPGCGKTSLARFAAQALGRRFYRETITSRTQASALQAGYDNLRRLSDAQVRRRLKPEQAYVQPGMLWWALQPATATQRGLAPLDPRWRVAPLVDPGLGAPDALPVLLLDEIDKADPDVPNDLLEALDEHSFTVPETGDHISVANRDLLIVLTTNDEREMPPAFLRRCVTLTLPPPTEDWLVDIAERRFGPGRQALQAPLYRRIAKAVMKRRDEAGQANRRPPSTSEFVDAVAACRDLLDKGTVKDGAMLEQLIDVATHKSTLRGAGDPS